MKNKIVQKLTLVGASTAVAISSYFLIIPQEGSVKDKQGNHVAYIDAVGVPTACYGQTGKDLYGRTIRKGMKYTEEECIDMLSDTVNRFESQVDQLVRVDFQNDFQKAATISFVYNIGVGAFKRSTALTHLNNGNYKAYCNEFNKWVYAGGRVLNGLRTRRKIESDWCLGKVPYNVSITHGNLAYEQLFKTIHEGTKGTETATHVHTE